MRGLLALIGLLLPFGAAAQVPSLCATVDPSNPDFDSDGFSDAQECAGVALLAGLVLPDGGTSVPNCAASSSASRSSCVDPATRDLFLIDQTTLPLPAEAFATFAKLGITLHKLVRSVPGTTRTVSAASPQNAIQVVTNPDSASGVIGRANWGTPNNLDGTTVFPNRITSYVNGLCPTGKECRTQAGEIGAPRIISVLTTWVADHEAGHTLALSRAFESRYGGYHEASGSVTVMEQTPKVVDKRGVVTFYIANAFSSVSATDAKLAGRK